MIILGCDFHPSWQQVSWLDTETGETGEQQLVHAEGQAQEFYQELSAPALIGMEATGNSQWFVELVADDAAGSGPVHSAGVRAYPGGRGPLSAWQAGGELSGTDSARRNLGRKVFVQNLLNWARLSHHLRRS